MTERLTPERAEQLRRSVAMLTVGQPALNREQPLDLLEQLIDELTVEGGATPVGITPPAPVAPTARMASAKACK